MYFLDTVVCSFQLASLVELEGADSAYKGPLCQARNRRSELKPGQRRQIEAAIGRSRPSFRRVNLPLAPRKAGASRRKPTPARPCTVARVVTNRTKRSDQAITLRRRSARMRRIDRLRRVAEMVQNPLEDGGLFNAGDHPQLPAALSAGLNKMN